MTTWAGLGTRIEELERQADDLQRIRCNQAETIKELRRQDSKSHDSGLVTRMAEEIASRDGRIANLRIVITNQLTEIKALHREVAILREYKRAVLILADAWDLLCGLFEGRGE